MAKSSGELMGVTMRSTVRKAAKFAVYDEISMSVKKNQDAAAIRPDTERGDRSQPCCIKADNEYQNEFQMLNSLTDEALPAVPDARPMLPEAAAAAAADRDACRAADVWTPGVGGPGGGGMGAPPMMPGGC